MNPTSITPPSKNQPWTRTFLMTVLRAAITAGETRFARQATLIWLAAYPGDLPVKLVRAKALLGGGHHHQAITILQQLCRMDPENIEAQKLLSKTSSRLGTEGGEVAQGCVLALGGKPNATGAKTTSPVWSKTLQNSRKAIQEGQLKKAERHFNQVLTEDPHTALAAITHLQLIRAKDDTPKPSILLLAQHYHERWPDCLQIMLILAEEQMDCGESQQTVALLHKAASLDVTGQVAKRLWGSGHPYQSLWPKNPARLY